MISPIKLPLFFIFLSFFYNSQYIVAQQDTITLPQIIANDKKLVLLKIQKVTAVKKFYTLYQNNIYWLNNTHQNNLNIILQQLQQAADLGLKEQDYHFAVITALRNNTLLLSSRIDTLETELRITDAVLHFYNDVAFGNTKPSLSYEGLSDFTSKLDICSRLVSYLNNQKLAGFISDISSTLPEVVALEKKIKWLRKIVSANNFVEIKCNATNTDTLNKPLLLKLYQLGFGRFRGFAANEKEVKQQLKTVQQQFNLLNDGKLRSTTIAELNVPLAKRIAQLNLSVNYYRWLSSLSAGNEVIVVNIPSTGLKVYSNNKVVLQMRVIVGKKATPTPTLSSMLKEVVLYPYWHVPYSIATKELLPSIKRNRKFIDEGNYQIINNQGKVIDPAAINWQSLNSGNFPYIIRQSTGCDNALGLLKLNFENPFSVYLHDTPNKKLFMLNNRFFSHGCMRMESPMDIGRFVLKQNSKAIDTLSALGCVQNKAPVIIPVKNNFPIVVWYNPLAMDAAGEMIFYPDIYGKF